VRAGVRPRIEPEPPEFKFRTLQLGSLILTLPDDVRMTAGLKAVGPSIGRLGLLPTVSVYAVLRALLAGSRPVPELLVQSGQTACLLHSDVMLSRPDCREI
jgi:hypothetical protein